MQILVLQEPALQATCVPFDGQPGETGIDVFT
jgi:hypothetical protein